MSVVWIHQYRPRTSWYSLTDDQQARWLAQWDEVERASAARTGTERLGEWSVRGVSRFERVVLWRFPGVQEVEGHWDRLRGAGYDDWRHSENLLGSPPQPFRDGGGA